MLIIADENIPQVEAAFSRFGEVRVFSGRHITPDDVQDANILLVRSVTQVNEALLSASQVRFVGSATIGTDHIDQQWLQQHGIGFINASGCNAISAAEYVMSALLVLAEDKDLPLQRMTMGIVGCGNVGSRVQARAEALGIKCLVCDPPRAEIEGSEGFVAMDEIAQADIITIHVPLIRDGRHPTYHMINAAFLNQLQAKAVFINTSRGDVVDEAALRNKAVSQPSFKMILDVWQGEPLIDAGLVECALIATPHIAGYSLDGKIRATATLSTALCDYLDKQADEQDWAKLAQPKQAVINPLRTDTYSIVRDCLWHVYDARRDDRALRNTLNLSDKGRAAEFDRLRRQYWPRRECGAYQVSAENMTADTLKLLEVYGFTVG